MSNSQNISLDTFSKLFDACRLLYPNAKLISIGTEFIKNECYYILNLELENGGGSYYIPGFEPPDYMEVNTNGKDS